MRTQGIDVDKKSFVTKTNKTIRVDTKTWDRVVEIAKANGEKTINFVERALKKEIASHDRRAKSKP